MIHLAIIDQEHRMFAQIPCLTCDEVHTIQIDRQGWEKYNNGESVQNSFPYLLPSLRDMFITSMCPKCTDEMINHLDQSFEERQNSTEQSRNTD